MGLNSKFVNENKIRSAEPSDLTLGAQVVFQQVGGSMVDATIIGGPEVECGAIVYDLKLVHRPLDPRDRGERWAYADQLFIEEQK